MLDKKLLHAIRTELFDERSFNAFKSEIRRVLAERLKSRNKDAGRIKADLVKTETALEKLTAAIEAAGHSDSLLARLKTLEADKRRLGAELDADLPALSNLEGLLEDALARYARVAYSLEDFSRRDVTRARNMIRSLVGGEIILRPTEGDGLSAQLTGDYGGLIELVKETSPRSKSRMVAGARNHLNLLLVAKGLIAT